MSVRDLLAAAMHDAAIGVDDHFGCGGPQAHLGWADAILATPEWPALRDAIVAEEREARRRVRRESVGQKGRWVK